MINITTKGIIISIIPDQILSQRETENNWYDFV